LTSQPDWSFVLGRGALLAALAAAGAALTVTAYRSHRRGR